MRSFFFLPFAALAACGDFAAPIHDPASDPVSEAGETAPPPKGGDTGEPAPACEGVDLATSATSCGVCGHACEGSTCRDKGCVPMPFSAFGAWANATIVAHGRDAGKIVYVLGKPSGEKTSTIVAFDPTKPGALPTVVGRDLFPRASGDARSAFVADHSVVFVRTTAIVGGEAAPCTMVRTTDTFCRRVDRVSLVTGRVEPWFARSTTALHASSTSFGLSGERLLELGSSTLVEWTKTAGQTGRRLEVGAGAGGLLVEGDLAWVITRGVLYRVDLKTFQATKRVIRAGTDTPISGASILGKRGDVLVMTFADGKRAALVAVDTSKPDQDPITLRTPAFAGTKSTGDLDGDIAVFSGDWPVSETLSQRWIAFDLGTGMATPVAPVRDDFVVLGRWVWSLDTKAETNTLYRGTP